MSHPHDGSDGRRVKRTPAAPGASENAYFFRFFAGLEGKQRGRADSYVRAAVGETEKEVGLEALCLGYPPVPEHGQLALRRAAFDHALATVEARADAIGRADWGEGTDFRVRGVLQVDHVRVTEERVAEGAERGELVDGLVQLSLERLVRRAGAEAAVFVAGRQLELRGEVEAERRLRLIERAVGAGERRVADAGFGGFAARTPSAVAAAQTSSGSVRARSST